LLSSYVIFLKFGYKNLKNIYVAIYKNILYLLLYMTFTTVLSDIANSTINMFYCETKIRPKYIIFCKGEEKKFVYQCFPKEIRTKIDNKEIIHKTYIQNTINNNDNIEIYTHAIIVDENDNEYKIEKDFLLKNMFNDIHNSINREYNVTNIINIPVKISEEYEKNEEKHKKVSYDKKKLLLFGGTAVLLTVGFLGKTIL
jgi:hypothetical protein